MDPEKFEFYWLADNKIAGSTLPTSIQDIQYLHSNDIKYIISTQSPSEVADLIINSKLDIKQLSLPIHDFGAPKKQQLEMYVKYLKTCFDNEEAVVIHCYAGCGRTGVLLMVYLMVFEALNFTTALHSLRLIRSCAVETKIQENFLQTLDISSYRNLL